MAFEDKKLGVENFIDYSANVGMAALWGTVIGMIFRKPLRAVVMMIELSGMYLAIMLRVPYLILRRVFLFKKIGVKCEGCNSWVSSDIPCPLCGQEHGETTQKKQTSQTAGVPAITTKAQYSSATGQELVTTHYEGYQSQDIQEYDTAADIYSLLDVFRSLLFECDIDHNGIEDIPSMLWHVIHVVVPEVSANPAVKAKFRNPHAYLISKMLDAAKIGNAVQGLDIQGKHKERLIQSFQYEFYGIATRIITSNQSSVSGHAQEFTRQKYERVLCPKCQSMSRVTTGDSISQSRVCTSCGHTFGYSNGLETTVRLYADNF